MIPEPKSYGQSPSKHRMTRAVGVLGALLLLAPLGCKTTNRHTESATIESDLDDSPPTFICLTDAAPTAAFRVISERGELESQLPGKPIKRMTGLEVEIFESDAEPGVMIVQLSKAVDGVIASVTVTPQGEDLLKLESDGTQATCSLQKGRLPRPEHPEIPRDSRIKYKAKRDSREAVVRTGTSVSLSKVYSGETENKQPFMICYSGESEAGCDVLKNMSDFGNSRDELDKVKVRASLQSCRVVAGRVLQAKVALKYGNGRSDQLMTVIRPCR